MKIFNIMIFFLTSCFVSAQSPGLAQITSSTDRWNQLIHTQKGIASGNTEGRLKNDLTMHGNFPAHISPQNRLNLQHTTPPSFTRASQVPLERTHEVIDEKINYMSGSSGAGNGGDDIRRRFIQIGQNILKYYKEGFERFDHLIKERGFKKVSDVQKILNIHFITLSTETLRDNTDQIVSALGSPEGIILYIGTENPAFHWNEIFKNIFSAEALVLHEMLRALNINDDNYVISKAILRIPDQPSLNAPPIWAYFVKETLQNSILSGHQSPSVTAELEIYRRDILSSLENTDLPVAELSTLYMRSFLSHDKLLVGTADSSELQTEESSHLSSEERLKALTFLRGIMRQNLSLEPFVLSFATHYRSLNQLDIQQAQHSQAFRSLNSFMQSALSLAHQFAQRHLWAKENYFGFLRSMLTYSAPYYQKIRCQSPLPYLEKILANESQISAGRSTLTRSAKQWEGYFSQLACNPL
jgi:hypothetical protein